MTIKERYDIIRSGARVGELQAVDAVSITMQTDSKTKTDFSGTFAFNPDFQRLTDRIRPMYSEGEEWISLGMYMVTQSQYSYEDDVGVMRLTGLDLGHLAERRQAEARPFFAKGLVYTDVVQTLLAECGIDRIRCTDTALRLRTDREDWDAGTSYIDIINQLLGEINYVDLWFDLEGYAVISPAGSETQRVYEADEMSVILPEYTIERDEGGAYNVFVAYVSNTDLAQEMVAVAENNDPSSAISTANIGRNPLVEQLSDIPNLEELERYVIRKRDASLFGTEKVAFETAVRAHGVGDVVYLRHHEAHGLYRETGWKITLGEGSTMTHTAERVVFL